MHEPGHIAYQGRRFALGQGQDYYGIWVAGQELGPPAERFAHTPVGWSLAWARYDALEHGRATLERRATGTEVVAPGSYGPGVAGSVGAGSDDVPAPEPEIAPIEPDLPAAVGFTAGVRLGTALLVVGIALGVASLFPTYLDGASLASQGYELAAHVVYLVAWSAAVGLLLAGDSLRRYGALLGAGASAVCFGLYFADLGSVISSGTHVGGAGLVLGLAGWLLAAVGSGIALRGIARAGALGRLRFRPSALAVISVLAAIGVAVSFAPAWDTFTLFVAATGRTYSVTAGNAFSEPAAILAGDVLSMVALAGIGLVALSLRPDRSGAVLLAGATLPMAAQAISAVVQWAGGATPALFGLTAAQTAELHASVSSGLTGVFYLFCALVVVLLGLCVRRIVDRPGGVGLEHSRSTANDATLTRW
jgi:hypothetical protein